MPLLVEFRGRLSSVQPVSKEYIVYSILAGVVGAAIGGALSINSVETDIIQILNTLALGKASVIAIVFSVAIIALQLVSNRYSPRLTSLFIGDPLFRTTFFLLVAAVAFDLIGIYLIRSLGTLGMNAYLGASGGISAIAVVVLYRFIQMAISRSSPDELISAVLDEELEPEHLIDTLESGNYGSIHPTHELYMILSRSMESGDYATTRLGLDGFETVLTETLEQLADGNHSGRDETVAGKISNPVLTDYFPNIMLQAFNHEQYDLIERSSGISNEVGQRAMESNLGKVAEHASDGLGDAFYEAPSHWEGNQLRSPATDALTDLLKTASKGEDYQTFRSIFANLNTQINILLRRGTDRDVTERLVRPYYGVTQKETIQNLLESLGPKIQDEDLNWLEPTDGRQVTLPSKARPIRRVWRKRVGLTKTILYYRLRTGDYPFAVGNLTDGWEQMVNSSIDAGFDELATLFCISMIELAYCVNVIEGELPGTWDTNLARVRNENEKIVEDAFDYLESGYTPESDQMPTNIRFQLSTESDDGLLFRFFGRGDKMPPELASWVQQFHEVVSSRSENL